ncbi:tyrosine-protein phosphatase [Alteromonas mediterranea]|uniref:protein-tyrosine-phosphatase n=1 Tax=Alteromonas mediterranea TaxID=314275 RepID=A0AAC8XJJ9_9ALTE|nr:CpsB/CapC family capsule biosynthesis tyrosine phosphatase [Alteromonas mediterranea]AFV85153.1 capsular polysaccharide biosynthesis protein [Alteromonas mediterranea DE1]AGP97164.1 capsular polysaccharide biosynthesis protein [Alteromonas mediterranea UM7]AGQ01508.1 capsular polysaccharide biosynthesis protein [Alteromonas mediterranea UM4b]AMJ78256.1 histidinol-phosphatase [Alteromonas mediterranea]AMJ82405.1 histidinol-phosphatase [Alteromonas mediterranea]
MIDLHSHILPGIDDGARSLDIALEMAEQAVSCGISHMVCTPHIHMGYFDNSFSSIAEAFYSFNEHVKRESIPLSLSFAAEVRVNELIPIWHKKGELPFLGKYDGKNVLLLEMPHSHIPQGLDVLIKWLLRNNIQPLIAHPERNRELIAENDKFNWLQRQGCLFQATAGAFVGRFGERVEEFAFRLLEKGAFHVVASDTHDLIRRPNDMQAALEVVSKYNSEYAEALFIKTPGRIIALDQNNAV